VARAKRPISRHSADCERFEAPRSRVRTLIELPPDKRSHQTSDVARVLLVVCGIIGLAYFLELEPRHPDERGASPHAAAGVGMFDTTQQAATEGVPRLPQTAAACKAALRRAGVEFVEVPSAAAGGVAWPVRLVGPIAGVRIEGDPAADVETSYLDCRLAVRLLSWAPSLRARGIVAIEHYSMYRPLARVEGTERPSGHAAGRAIDVGRLQLQDGRKLSVLDDWKNRKLSSDPCGKWRDAEDGRLLRELTCDVAARGLFQVIVTPHHNAAHANHLHFEIDPAAESLWIR
jgi:hypothetical protein